VRPLLDRLPSRIRPRTPVVLLGALLVTSIAISGLAFQLVRDQRSMLESAIRDSQQGALELLANRVEHALLGAMQDPLLPLINLPQVTAADLKRIEAVKTAFPEVEEMLLLDARMKPVLAYPPATTRHRAQFDAWLIQRLVLEKTSRGYKSNTFHSFLETLDGRPVLFSFRPVSYRDDATPVGWLLVQYKLDTLRQRHVDPLLNDFGEEQGGTVTLHDAGTVEEQNYMDEPLSRVLPGWSLVFVPDPEITDDRLQPRTAVLLTLAGGMVLVMLLATFAVWHELRREHALMELRNRFVANVSHELKTPLALIRMYAETLYLRRVTDESRQHLYHRTILRESERLTQMINTVLDFSRLGQGVEVYHLTDTDLAETVAGVIEDYRERIEEQGLHLEADVQPDLPPVAHDRRGVTQILLNLLDNAVKYAARGGQVRVQLAPRGENVDLAVIDSGPGIPPRERERLRTAFERGDDVDAHSGSGLGLAVVDQIAEAHHARVTFETPRDGNGLEAVVSFPALRSAA
jgi:signal transduction histidine kinase